MGDEEHDASVTIICNGKSEGSKKVELGKEHAGEVWTDVMGWRQGEITIGEGTCLLIVPSGSSLMRRLDCPVHNSANLLLWMM